MQAKGGSADAAIAVAERLGLEIKPELVVSLDRDMFSPELGYPVVERLLETRQPFTALVAFTRKAPIAEPVAEGVERLFLAVKTGPPVQQVVVKDRQQLHIARVPGLGQAPGASPCSPSTWPEKAIPSRRIFGWSDISRIFSSSVNRPRRSAIRWSSPSFGSLHG